MEKIKKGDIVARKSHNQDILFSVENILGSSGGIQIAILKGITIRIVADAYINDLVLLDTKEADASLRSLDVKIEDRINNLLKKGKEKLLDKERYFGDTRNRKNFAFGSEINFIQKNQQDIIKRLD